MLARQQGLAVSVQAPAKVFLGFRLAEADFSCFCAEITRHTNVPLRGSLPSSQLSCSGIPLIMGKHLSSPQSARRSASSITNMNNKRNLFKPLADQGPRNMAAASQLGSRVKQARPSRQPATASLALGCWNIRSLGPQTEATPFSPGRQL